MTKTTNNHLVDIHALLEERRQVAVIWGIADVQGQRPDLTDGQAWEVLQQCRRVHDCSVGFTWELIDCVADDMFPDQSPKLSLSLTPNSASTMPAHNQKESSHDED
jgi:hypothetical protein